MKHSKRKLTSGRRSLHAVDGRSWRYHRLSQQGASKWVLGNNWVTKWDKERFCHIGIDGTKVTDWKVDRPKAAREAIECVISASSNENKISYSGAAARPLHGRSAGSSGRDDA